MGESDDQRGVHADRLFGFNDKTWKRNFDSEGGYKNSGKRPVDFKCSFVLTGGTGKAYRNPD